MVSEHSDVDYVPKSLWECQQLLSKPLGRDHILVKGVDKRNLIPYEDVTRGVGTECTRESQLRTSLAVGQIAHFKSEISFRNADALGGGLIRSLLALETSTDDDGVPLEAEETVITDIISELMIEILIKAGPQCLEHLSTSMIGNKEILMYTKYKLLHSMRKAIRGLENRLEDEKSSRQSIENNTSKSAPSNAIVQLPRQISLTVLKTSFSEFVSSCIDKNVTSITTIPEINPFTDQLLLTELIATKLALFKISKNDLSIIESLIPELSRFVSVRSDLDENFLRAYLQLLVTTPQVLLELVEDPHTLHLVRNAICSLISSTNFEKLPSDISEVISLIQDCIFPTAPQLSI